jgi:hypothetical protein
VILGETGWAWAALIAATATVVAVQARVPHAPEYGLAAAWAFAAVAVQNWGASLPLVMGALAAALLVAVHALTRRGTARAA